MGIKTKVTYKGKPFDGEVWKNDIIKSMMNNVRKLYEDKITAALTPEELKQITLDFSDDDGKTICKIKGPEDIVKKATKSISG